MDTNYTDKSAGIKYQYQERILPDNFVKKLDKFHSYLTYFLLGSFVGIAVIGTYDKFIGLPSIITEKIGMHVFSVIIGSAIAMSWKYFFKNKDQK